MAVATGGGGETAVELSEPVLLLKYENAPFVSFSYENNKVDEDTQTYGWTYDGGCFEDGAISNWMPAKPGVDYSFDKLDFEIRESNPSLAYMLGYSWRKVFMYLAFIALFAAIIAFILYIFQTVKAR